jgi:hypothetical protein
VAASDGRYGSAFVRMVVGFKIVGPMRVFVRFAGVLHVLVLVAVTFVGIVGVRVRMLMNVGMGVFVHMLMRVRLLAVAMFVSMAVQMRMRVIMAVFVVGVHAFLRAAFEELSA